MERLTDLHADGPASRRPSRLWLLLFGLLAWQAVATFGLFGRHLLDDVPVVSGRHPLHLYHGALGAWSLRERGTASCYDPAFQAGYPKTVLFDAGSRPAELFLVLAGGYSPAAYKLGMAACCLVVPLLLFVAARGVGLGLAGCLLATAAGQMVFWTAPGRRLLDDGDLDLLLAALAAVAQAGALVRLHDRPGVFGWAGTFLAGLVGWYAAPLLFAVLLPLILIYYLSVGARHPLGWHLALLGALAGAVIGNGFGLTDWLRQGWVRVPFAANAGVLPQRSLPTLWAALLWRESADHALASGLFLAAAVGAVVWNQTQQRPAARLFGLGAAALLALALGGVAYEPLVRLGTDRFLAVALWFAALPAAHAGVQACLLTRRLTGSGWRTAAAAFAISIVVVWLGWGPLAELTLRCVTPAPLALGLAPDAEQLVALVREHTTAEARILWEDDATDQASRWPALLPVLTGRDYLGGLDPEGCIEHSAAGLANGMLAGRPLAAWSDAELTALCRRYHLGWAVCRSPTAIARLRAWPGAGAVATLPGSPPGSLFRLPTSSFVLKGQARLIEVSRRRVALADVVPEDGIVVLSLHYHAGMVASPIRVQVERETDPDDPIPFVRLRLPGPVARLTLTWDGR